MISLWLIVYAVLVILAFEDLRLGMQILHNPEATSLATLPRLSAFSVPLHPLAASNLLTVEFPLDVRCDPKLCGVPEAIHLTGEVFGELG